jgi:hypothetical protein
MMSLRMMQVAHQDGVTSMTPHGIARSYELLKLLKAEQLSIHGNVVDLMTAYQLAFASFEATHTLHMEALTAERATTF